MKRIVGLAFALFSILVIPSSLDAQQYCGFSFNAQYALMNMWGKNAQTQDIWGVQERNLDKAFVGLSVHEKYEPIDITTGRSYSLRASIFNRRCGSNWGYGVKGWFFNSSAASVDTIRTTENSPGLHGLRVQGGMIFPGFNTRSPTGLSDIHRAINNKVFPWKADFLAVRQLVENPSESSVSMILGVSLAGYQDQNLNVAFQRIFIDNYFEGKEGNAYHLDLDYVLQDQSVAEYSRMVGPTFGLTGYLREGKRLLLRGTIQQSVVFGTADFTGASVVVQDQYVSQGSGESTERVVRYLTDIEQHSLESTERSAVSISGFEFDATVAITKSIALNAGGFVSVWNDLPAAPRWSSSSSSWVIDRNTPIFAGLSFGAVYRMRAF